MLNTKQEQVITLILAGETQAAAAEAVGVTPETVSRWKQEPEFIAALNQAQQETLDAQRKRLQTLVDDALQVYTDVLRESEDPKLRLRAARDVLGAVGLDEVPEPSGPTTVEGVEKQRAIAAAFDFDW